MKAGMILHIMSVKVRRSLLSFWALGVRTKDTLDPGKLEISDECPKLPDRLRAHAGPKFAGSAIAMRRAFGFR